MEISVYADGQNVQNIKPLKTKYKHHQLIHAYNTLYTGTGRLFYDEGLAINRLEYPNGYTLYAFNLSPDLIEDEKFQLLHNVSMRLQLKFQEEVAGPITLIINTEYQNLIEIDHN